MSDPKKISRRELFHFWRREPAPLATPVVPSVPPLAIEAERSWPRDRIPGPSLGRLLPLRPPGNMQEYILREACTRCGKCVEACPAHAIFPLGEDWGESGRGTPAIDPRKAPCVACDGFACTQVCPSGALQPLYNINEIKMGTAAVERSRCVTYAGQACDACVRICPVPGALRLDADAHPLVDENTCIGCGLCVRECPTDPGALAIIPRD